jgi:folate-binding protein YgfZ
MEDTDSPQLLGYHAALEGAAFYPYPDRGCLRLQGADRIDFLQRQSTNDLRLLDPGRALTTVLTSPTARILDVLTLLWGEESLSALTLPGRAETTARFLTSRIFFMDKVTVADISADCAQMLVTGKGAGDVLSSVGLEYLPEVGQLHRSDVDGFPVQVMGREMRLGGGYWIVAEARALGRLASLLTRQGAHELSQASHEVLRIERGLPGPARELTDTYTPLEIGLGWAVSDVKGCYTGQEIIARQQSYDKVTRRLVGLKAAHHPIAVGAEVQAEGRSVGEVTSAALSPRFGPIGLAVVKRSHHEPGSRVQVVAQGQAVDASVEAIPFLA